VNDFQAAFQWVLSAEGAETNDPNDPGGLTRYGISQRAHPKVDVAKLTVEEARDIYLNGYWGPAKCRDLPWPLSLYVFDAAVNQGVLVAIKMLQAAAGVAQDGILGQKTLRAVNARDLPDLCAAFMAQRALRYMGTRNFDLYGKGWLKRLFDLSFYPV